MLPISSGANGLNLIQARHVVLVEPILNPGAEVQAIGRVHRIGQHRETVVHRFLIKDTIEERMFSILHPKVMDKAFEEKSLAIDDLHKLFVQTDEVQQEVEDEEQNTSSEFDLQLS